MSTLRNEAQHTSVASATGTAVSLQNRIRAHLHKGTVSVAITDNRYTMISVRRDGQNYALRLHHMFVDAQPVFVRALARYIVDNDPEASRLLGQFIDANQDLVRPRERRGCKRNLITRGACHDLDEIFDSVNHRYFQGAIAATITWGQRMGKPRRRNSIKMGSYSIEDRHIRVHRALDRSFVPRFFVEWIVYHEMLHQVHDAIVINGRRRFHTREFLKDEAMFELYERARAWEREHLDELLTY